MKNIILYHANCYDGFGSAYAAWKHFGDDAEYHAMYYDAPLPEIKGGDKVFLLDYSRKCDDLVNMVASGAMVEIHDHHKSAVDEINKASGILHQLYDEIGFTKVVMDMSKSGAVLAWERFHPETNIPMVIRDIMDRDLWLFKRAWSKEIHAALCSLPFDFEIWDELITSTEDPDDYVCWSNYEKLIAKGKIILGYRNQLVEKFCENVELADIDGHQVPLVNISMLFSEVPHRLLQLYPESPFSAYRYFRKGGVIQYGLRGRGDFDVSEVAKKFGGGGHFNAAGYEVKE